MKKIMTLKALLIAAFMLGLQVFATAEPASATVDQAAGLIATGRVEEAEEMLSNLEGPKAKQLFTVIDQYHRLSEKREQARKEMYLEKLEEFEEIKKEQVPTDPNDMGDAYVVLISMRKYATEEQIEEVLSEEFVKELADKTIAYNIEQEAQGKWAEAYTGYY